MIGLQIEKPFTLGSNSAKLLYHEVILTMYASKLVEVIWKGTRNADEITYVCLGKFCFALHEEE